MKNFMGLTCFEQHFCSMQCNDHLPLFLSDLKWHINNKRNVGYWSAPHREQCMVPNWNQSEENPQWCFSFRTNRRSRQNDSSVSQWLARVSQNRTSLSHLEVLYSRDTSILKYSVDLRISLYNPKTKTKAVILYLQLD